LGEGKEREEQNVDTYIHACMHTYIRRPINKINKEWLLITPIK